MTCTVMLNKSKGTHHQLVVGFIIAAATKRKKEHPPKAARTQRRWNLDAYALPLLFSGCLIIWCTGGAPPPLINIVVHLNQTPRLSTTKARSTQELNIKLSFLTTSHPRCGAGDWPRVVGCWVGAGFGSGAHLVPGSLLVW